MNKKILIVLALVLAISMMLPALVSAETIKLAHKDGSLTVRKGAGTSYDAVAYVKDGSEVTVLSKGSVWSKIETASGKVGYVKNLYISGVGSNYADGTTYLSSAQTGTVKTKYASSTVNLRAGASTSTSSIGKIANGTKVKVLGKNGNFYLVETKKGTQGYMSKNYISTAASKPAVVTATVTASALNMRKSASSSAAIVTTLAKGTKVTVLSTSGNWWKVQYGSKTGYMAKNYLKKN